MKFATALLLVAGVSAETPVINTKLFGPCEAEETGIDAHCDDVSDLWSQYDAHFTNQTHSTNEAAAMKLVVDDAPCFIDSGSKTIGDGVACTFWRMMKLAKAMENIEACENVDGCTPQNVTDQDITYAAVDAILKPENKHVWPETLTDALCYGVNNMYGCPDHAYNDQWLRHGDHNNGGGIRKSFDGVHSMLEKTYRLVHANMLESLENFPICTYVWKHEKPETAIEWVEKPRIQIPILTAVDTNISIIRKNHSTRFLQVDSVENKHSATAYDLSWLRQNASMKGVTLKSLLDSIGEDLKKGPKHFHRNTTRDSLLLQFGEEAMWKKANGV